MPGAKTGSAAGIPPGPVTAAPASPVRPVAKSPTTTTGADRHESASGEASTTPSQQALAAGIDAYNNGDFNGAIKRLGAAEIQSADKATQLSALKYMAFSYCVTRRQTLCRQQFVKALKIDPGFELAAGEKGHPLWTPAFEAAKKVK